MTKLDKVAISQIANFSEGAGVFLGGFFLGGGLPLRKQFAENANKSYQAYKVIS